MRKYELTLLTDEKSEPEIERLLEGKEYKLEYDGYIKLPYPINEFEYAHRYYVEVELTSLEAKLLNRTLQDMPWCLRFLLVPRREENTLGKVQKIYQKDDLSMYDLLAGLKCKELDEDMTIEQAFELYCQAKEWADGDKITIEKGE